jgi:hypothetical protein
MNAPTRPSRVTGITLRQAALIAGLMYLLDPVSYAEFNFRSLVALRIGPFENLLVGTQRFPRW